MTDPIKVLVAEDQERMRKATVELLSDYAEMIVVGEAANGEEACAMASELLPDVILMDIRMPICDGISATEKIKAKHPAINILIVTTYDDADLVVKALKAGACGYILKDMPTPQIVKAIQTVVDGNLFLGQDSGSKIIEKLHSKPHSERKHLEVNKDEVLEQLTKRELDILKLIGEGKTNYEISTVVHMSEGAVRNYVSRIFGKIDARDRIQAVLIAQELF